MTHYLAQLREQDEHNVIVVGSSIGGWIALEMARRPQLSTGMPAQWAQSST